MFKEYCADKGLVGQFVYEQEKLSDDFFREIPKENKDRIGISGDFYIDNKKYLIDADKFEKHYSITYVKLDQLSKIGPIYAKETSVVRKKDGKLLGKSVSLNNKKGWLHELNFLMVNTGDTCPIYITKDGQRISNPDHSTLIQNIFKK